MKHAETFKMNLMYSDTGLAKITQTKNAVMRNTWTLPSQSKSTAGQSGFLRDSG